MKKKQNKSLKSIEKRKQMIVHRNGKEKKSSEIQVYPFTEV